MPEPAEPLSQDQRDRATLEAAIANHPGLAGRMESRDGAPYAPVNLPNDPTAQQYLDMYAKPNGGEPAPVEQSSAPAPAAETQPAPQPAQVAPTDTSGRLIAGKYRSVDEAERGIEELNKTLRERNQENVALRAVNQHFEQLAAVLRPKREEPPVQPRAIKIQFDPSGQPFIPDTELDEIASRRASESAREAVEQYLAPITKLGTANQRLRATYPEFSQNESGFAAWLGDHQDVNQRVLSDPDFALEAAYLKFERERGQHASTVAQQTTQAAQAAVQQARSNASPAGGAPTARRQTNVDAQDQYIREAQEHGFRTGDWRPYTRARMEQALGPDYMATLERTTWGR